MRKKILPGIVVALMSLVLVFSVFSVPAFAATSLKKATVSISATYYTYTGKTIKPAVTVKLGKKKVSSKNYTVSYKNNKSVGKATITVKGKGSYKDSATKSFYIRPKKVASLKATPYSTKVKLSWGKVTGAKGYQVYQYEDGSWKKLPTTSSTSCTVSKLESATEYKFKVRAYAKAGSKSLYSSSFTTVTTTTTIGKPTVTVSDVTENTAKLEWTKVTAADEYRITLTDEVTGTDKTFTTSETSYLLSGLNSFRDYTVKIRAYNKKESILGNPSDYVAFKTIPGPVTSLRAQSTGATEITLAWDKMDNVTGYEVHMCKVDSDGKEGEYTRLAGVKTATYTVKNLTPYSNYIFKIRVYIQTSSGRTYGLFAETDKIVTEIGKVTNFIEDGVTNNSISLKWDSVEGATGYELYMGGKKQTLSSPLATSHTVTGLAESTYYNFYIKAYYQAEDGKVYESENTVLSTVKTDDSKVDSVEFTYKPVSLSPGKTDKVTARVLPEYAANKKIIYKSSNTAVATISDSGQITAKAKGSTVITATSDDGGKTASFTLTVKNVVSTDIYVPATMSINVGETAVITPTFTPSNTSDKSFTVTGADYTYSYKTGIIFQQTKTETLKASDYISIGSNGVITGLKATTEPQTGKVFAFTLTVRASDSGVTSAISVTVVKKMINITYQGDDNPWYYGNSAKLTATVDSSISSKNPVSSLKWTSDTPSVATVSSDGTVKCVGKGMATISASTSDGKYSSSFQIFCRGVVEIEKDYFQGCQPGRTYQINASLKPAGDGEKILYASKNEDVAEVDSDGTVTFKKSGYASVVVMTTTDTVNYKEVWFTSGSFTGPTGTKMQLFQLLKENADSVKTSANLPGFYRNDSSTFSNFTLTGKGTFGNALSKDDLQGMFSDLAAPKSFHQAPVASGSTSAWENYMLNVPVRGQYMTIVDGLEDADIKSVYVIDRGSYTYDLKLTLEEESFTYLPPSGINTRHGKVFDILTSSYLSGALSAINNSGSGTKIEYASFTQRYHDSSLTVSVNKVTGKVVELKYDMNIDINITDLKIAYSGISYTADTGFDCNNVVKLSFYEN